MLLENIRPDLILLDLMLPGLSGEDVLSHIRGIPVIVVSAKGDVDDKVALLLGGAADYITKPFDTRELLARITVCLRNAPFSGNAPVLSFENISLHPQSHQVTVQNQPVKLTKTEYAILKLLLANPSPGDFQIRYAGTYFPGYPGLCGKLPEGSCKPSAQQTERCGPTAQGLYRSCMGHWL